MVAIWSLDERVAILLFLECLGLLSEKERTSLNLLLHEFWWVQNDPALELPLNSIPVFSSSRGILRSFWFYGKPVRSGPVESGGGIHQSSSPGVGWITAAKDKNS